MQKSPQPFPTWLDVEKVGLIPYGVMQAVSSLRELERRARLDMGCM